jgi:hypothetical protein
MSENQQAFMPKLHGVALSVFTLRKSDILGAWNPAWGFRLAGGNVMQKGRRVIIRFLLFFVIIFFSSCAREDIPERIEIPFVLENDRMILNATVNGVKGRYIFDTGGTISLVPLNVDNLRRRGFAWRYNKGEKYKQRIYKLNSISFGETEVKARSWVTNDSFATSPIYKLGYTGLLGILTFEGYWCEISFSEHKIILHKEKPGYFTESLPVSVESKYNPQVKVSVNVDGQELYLMVDTGWNMAFGFPKGLADNTAPDKIKEIMTTREGGPLFYMIHTDSMKIIDETHENNFIVTNSTYETRSGKKYHNIGVLGITYLKYYDLLFDFRELRKGKSTAMYYKANTPLEERKYDYASLIKTTPELGILDFEIRENSGIRIISMIKDSMAHTKFGLKPGDIVTHVNGRPVLTSYSMPELLDREFYLEVEELGILENGTARTIKKAW